MLTAPSVLSRQRNLAELPLDLYRPILQHLRGDQRALRALTLVNRDMYSEAMIMLYERIELSTGSRITTFVKGATKYSDIPPRIHALVLNLTIDIHSTAHKALVELFPLLTELVELRVFFRALTIANLADYGAMLLDCPSTKLAYFTWDSMYSAPVRDFILRQPNLKELVLTDGAMVVGRHDEFPPHYLTHLSRIAGDARWIAQIARGRPIQHVTVTRTTFSASADMLRALSNSNGPCTGLSSPVTSPLSGLYPGDVLQVVQWLPNLLELGDCYLYDPYTMMSDSFFQAVRGFTCLERLRIVDNSDWEGGKFDVPDAQRIQREVPTLRSVDVISMGQTNTRTFVRKDIPIEGGRTRLYRYEWMEHMERSGR